MVIVAALFSQILLLESSEHNPQVLCLFSQGSVQRGETPSLNNFLGRTSDRSVSPVRSQCSGIFMNQSIFRYLSREIGQFQSTWAHFGKNKTMRPHMNMPTSRSLRFLWGSEFKITQTKNRSILENAETGIWRSCSFSPIVIGSRSDRLLVLTISASTQRYYRRKAEQVLDIAIAQGNSPIRLPRGYIKVCPLFADL